MELFDEFYGRARLYTTIVDGRWGVLIRFRPGNFDPAPAAYGSVPIRVERRTK